MAARRPNLRHWTPLTHNLAGRAVGVYDGSLLLDDARALNVGDYVLVGPARDPITYRVRHLAYAPGYPAYWRVQVEQLELIPAVYPACDKQRNSSAR